MMKFLTMTAALAENDVEHAIESAEEHAAARKRTAELGLEEWAESSELGLHDDELPVVSTTDGPDF